MIALCLVFFIFEALIAKYDWRFGHASFFCLLAGIAMSFILYGVRGNELAKTFYFEENFFFGVILPPIVFSSGYNMH